jgi:glycosyltransferase involved in cell wall biosynthesis
MRILFLAEASSVHSHRWIRYFAEQGHSIEWVSLSDANGGSTPSGVRFHPVGYPRSRSLRILRATAVVRNLLHDGGFDIVHAHYAGSYGLVGALSGFHPFVLTPWGSDVLHAGRRRFYRPLIRFTVRRADLITCDAEHLRDAVVNLGAERDRVRLVYFGTDTDRFHPGLASEDLRFDLGASDAPLIISARTLHPLYDVSTLLRAVPEVLREWPNARIVVAGDGPQRHELEALSASLGISGATRFVGSLSPDHLAIYLATADVYVSTSTSDGGLAATTAEAMACATPVIITDFGQNRAWVDDGRSGVIVPIGDSRTLSAAILRLLRDDTLRREMGRTGRAVIEQRNSYRREMGRMEQMYESLVVPP